jgi:iron(II)-dependent oxidoreductase
VLEVIAGRGVGDGTLHEMVLRHEPQHNETMLQTIQLAQLLDYAPAGNIPPARTGFAPTGLELIEVPGGECMLGASERPPAGLAAGRRCPLTPSARVTAPTFAPSSSDRYQSPTPPT